MSSPIVTPQDPAFDYVQHPTLGQLKFPKQMSPDERNASITYLMAQQKTGLSQSLREAGSRPFPSPSAQYNEDDYDDSGSSYFPGEPRKIDPNTNRVLRHGMPGSFEGHPENIGQYPVATAGRAAEGIVDISRGNVSMGLHKEVQAGMNALAPMAPITIAGAPITAARAIAGGYLAGKATKTGAQLAGASPDQQALAEDVGNIAGGGAAATGLARAVLGSPAKALVGRAIENPYVSALTPARLLSVLRTMSSSSAAAELPSLSTTAREVRGPFQSSPDTSVTPSGNIDRPPSRLGGDIEVRPAQVTSDNLLQTLRAKAADIHGNKPEAFDVTPPENTQVIDKAGFNDSSQTFIRPSRMGTRQGIEDMLAAAKKGGSAETTARVDAHKVAKTAIGKDVAGSGASDFLQSDSYQPQGFLKQYPAPEQPSASLSEVRAASSPNPPRSSLAKNQRQLGKADIARASNLNSPEDVAGFQEQASQELFGKSYKELPTDSPLMRLRATMRATELQAKARGR